MSKVKIIGIIIIITLGLILTYTNFFNVVDSQLDDILILPEISDLEREGKKNSEPQIGFEQTKLSGIAYSPYRKDQSPITGPHPSIEEIENDIKLLSSITKKIRIYGLDGNSLSIPEIAEKYEVKVAVTLLLTGDTTDYDKIERAVNLANKYDDTIYTIIVENEGLYRNTLSEEQIINYLTKARENLNSTCTITIAEPVGNWLEHGKIAKHVDYVMIHKYPYFDGVDISDAANKVFDEYENVKKLLEKEVVIGETNWPSSGLSVNRADPSPKNQQKFISEFIKIADSNEIEYFIFEAFDEKWKSGEQFNSGVNHAENHWGLFFENGTIKEPLKNTISPTQNITTRN